VPFALCLIVPILIIFLVACILRVALWVVSLFVSMLVNRMN